MGATSTAAASGLTVSTGVENDTSQELKGEVERGDRRRRVRSWYAHMVLIHLSEFGAEAARGLVLPTLFTYVQELGGGLEDIGLLTALFSVGRFFSSLLFGWLCDRTSFRVLYNVAGCCGVVGNLLYVLPYSPSVHSRTLLALSRFVIGFGAGNRSVCRANIAMLTHVDQRLKYFTIFATVVFLAYALTPGLGSVIGDTHFKIGGDLLQFNRITAPGFLLVGLNLTAIIYNNIIYDDSVSRDDAPTSPKLDGSDTCPSPKKANPEKVLTITVSDSQIETQTNKEKTTAQMSLSNAVPPALSERAVTVGMLVFIFLNFNARGILSIFETVNVPLFLEMTNRNTKAEQDSVAATQEASSFYLTVGLLGLISYGCVHILRKKVSDVGFLLFGFAMLLIGNVILLALCADMHERSDDIDFDHSQEQFNIFVVAEVFVWSVGCPLTSAVVVSAFSKVLGSRPQGMLMGVFGASASVARMVMPFLPSLLKSWSLLFLANMVLCAICILVLSIYLGFISANSAPKAYNTVKLNSDGREPQG